ncbi:hypothetical protein IQ07DRAFT_582619 [Pyrenochaeta sp. DS3sAY3a]|nr:hypothetical protein IQ07DRAFT_582619 [Pyrenochaeta sp. DS3sAY3a]
MAAILTALSLLILVLLCAQSSQGEPMTARKTCRAGDEHCGWELMEEYGIPIARLGDLYVRQTGDRSLCSVTEKGVSYCTCVFECGNGVWRCDGAGGFVFKQGCKKYCHAGVCDG